MTDSLFSLGNTSFSSRDYRLGMNAAMGLLLRGFQVLQLAEGGRMGPGIRFAQHAGIANLNSPRGEDQRALGTEQTFTQPQRMPPTTKKYDLDLSKIGDEELV